jgi:hypothetical protein
VILGSKARHVNLQSVLGEIERSRDRWIECPEAVSRLELGLGLELALALASGGQLRAEMDN